MSIKPVDLTLNPALFLAPCMEHRTLVGERALIQPVRPALMRTAVNKAAHDNTRRTLLQHAFMSSACRNTKADQLRYSAACFPSECGLKSSSKSYTVTKEDTFGELRGGWNLFDLDHVAF